MSAECVSEFKRERVTYRDDIQCIIVLWNSAWKETDILCHPNFSELFGESRGAETERPVRVWR